MAITERQTIAQQDLQIAALNRHVDDLRAESDERAAIAQIVSAKNVLDQLVLLTKQLHNDVSATGETYKAIRSLDDAKLALIQKIDNEIVSRIRDERTRAWLRTDRLGGIFGKAGR